MKVRKRKDNKVCFFCDRRLTFKTFSQDHLLPKSRQGTDNPKNIVDACRKCNQDKGSLTLPEYRAVVAFRLGRVPKKILAKVSFPGEIKPLK